MKIKISNNDGYFFEETMNLIYITAEGSYSTIFLRDGRKIIVSYSLKKIQVALKDYHFLRISRSVIINIHCVAYIDKKTLSCYVETGQNKIALSVSKCVYEKLNLNL
ncbi:MAG: LytTR family transcriptional regulator [Prolixibacteraceae bacterium]|nr:LytTR family transcriptional regulator [Prolixibacteraceae bacterium]